MLSTVCTGQREMTDNEIRARIAACHTSDGIDHGKRHLEDCLDAVIEKYEDGYIYCPIAWAGGNCEECMEIFERRMERFE